MQIDMEALKAGLTAAGLFCAFVIVVVALAATVHSAWQEARGRLSKCDKRTLAAFAALLTLYAGAKHIIWPPDAGADAGISIVGVVAIYTNEVTYIDVKYIGSGVTTNTPVSVRNSDSEEWRELVKVDATVTSDLPTNMLSFVVSGNAETNRYWWVGVDKPSIIVETAGIEIVYFLATSHSVQIAWTCDDQRAYEFSIQRRRKGETWDTVAVTTDTAFEYVGFTVGESWEWRVISTYYAEGEQ